MTAPVSLSAIREQYEDAPRLLVAGASPHAPASVYEESDGLETICYIPGYYSPEAQNALARRIAAAPSTVERLLGALERVEAVIGRLDDEIANSEAGERNAAEADMGAYLMACQSETFAYKQVRMWLRAAIAGEGA